MEQKLTLMQAYKAMYAFIRNFYYRIGESDELVLLLSDMQLLDDNTSADPAAWQDWLEAIEECKEEEWEVGKLRE